VKPDGVGLGTVHRDDYVRSIRADGDALAHAAEGAMSNPVPWCPGWTGHDVVAHTGRVHRLIGDRVRRGSRGEDDVERPVVPEGDAVLPWYRDGLDQLVEVLAATDPNARVWNWSSIWPDTAAFWPRRMAHETAVHRYDAEGAAGATRPIATALAADGVDEFLAVHFAEDAAELTGGGEAVVVRTTDAGGAWTVVAGPGGATIEAGAADGAAATLEGGVSDLVLVLWRRLPPDAVTVSGDPALAERFLAAADLS
jgi:uncharacterized protein (TIGR03083 family)